MNVFFGVIAKVLDPELYTIEVDIPGEGERLRAFPFRGEIDEPRVGDVVFLREMDPNYHSYYLYEKLKENDFIGFRARGKKIWVNKDEFIQIGIFPPDSNNSKDAKEFPKTVKGEWYDDKSGKNPTPDCTSWIKIDKEGNIDIEMEGTGHMHITKDHDVKIDGNLKVEIGGNAEVKIGGNLTAEVSGNADINVSGSTKLTSPDVTITGGKATIKGAATPDSQGPWCGLPNCVFSGCPQSASITTT